MKATLTGRRWATALSAAALLATMSACGGSDDGGDADDVASLGTSDGSTGTTDESGDDEVTPEDREEAMLAYAECMREQGIDMPDPEMEGGGIAIAVDGDEVDMDEFEAAGETCQPIMEDVVGEVEMDPEREAELQAQLLEYAQCMRDHGIDMPDPDFDNGRITMGHERGDGDDGDFKAADAACATGPMGPGGATPAGGDDDATSTDDGDGPSFEVHHGGSEGGAPG